MGEQEVADAVVEGVVDAAFALEGVSLAEGAAVEQELDDFEAATEACLARDAVSCQCPSTMSFACMYIYVYMYV